jgi:hypothetical protein
MNFWYNYVIMPILRIGNLALSILIPAVEAAYCPITGFPCPSGGNYFSDYLGRIATGIAVAVAGIIAGMIIFYSLKLAVSGSNESHVTEVRNAYLHLVFGAVLIAGAGWIARIVLPSSAVATPGLFNTNVLKPVQNFFFGMMGMALVVNIGYHGARLIVSQDDSGMSNARQGMIRGIIGLTIVMVCAAVLGSFHIGNDTNIKLELFGAGNFIITIFGALALVALVVAGLMLVISVEEQVKERAKKIMLSVMISVIVVSAAGAVITAFI